VQDHGVGDSLWLRGGGEAEVGSGTDVGLAESLAKKRAAPVLLAKDQVSDKKNLSCFEVDRPEGIRRRLHEQFS
jgi:hypothetical protein